MKEGFHYFERRRRALSAMFVIMGLGLVVLTHHSWSDEGNIDIVFDAAGIALVVAGILGRLWATAYIGGKKNVELVVKGPYSITRNPLYFFSFLAGLGVCVEMENIYLLALYMALFPLSYHFVIKSEEKRLSGIFGERFEEYRRTTPAFFPNVFKLDMGVIDTVTPGLLKKTLKDASVFVLLLFAAYAIEALQEAGVLYTMWNVP